MISVQAPDSDKDITMKDVETAGNITDTEEKEKGKQIEGKQNEKETGGKKSTASNNDIDDS